MAIYEIPVPNYGALADKIATLNKRAAKLDVPPIAFAPTGAEWCSWKYVDANGDRTYADAPDARRVTWRVIEVDISGGQIALPGWTFIGTVQHTKAGNILRGTPETEVPETYRDRAPLCEHCGTKRRRKDTYIVRHDDGTFRQIGRSCIRDFLGHRDAELLAKLAEYLRDAIDAAGDDDGWDRGNWVPTSYAVTDVAATAFAAVRRWDGYRNRNSFGPAPTTAGAVAGWLSGSAKEVAALTARGFDVRDGDWADATEALAWLAGTTDGGYIGNLRTAAAMGYITGRELNLLASLPAARAHALRGDEIAAERAAKAAEREAAKAARTNAPTGRVTITGTIASAREVDTGFGFTFKAKVDTDDGWGLWTTVPMALVYDAEAGEDADALVGKRITMTVTVEPSKDDPTFAWGKRPTKASIIEAVPA